MESPTAAAEYAVAVSPDDKSVYSGGLDGLSVFDRDPGLGSARPEAGQRPAASTSRGSRSSRVHARRPRSTSPTSSRSARTGSTSTSGSFVNDILTIFDRDATGALPSKAGRDGCVSAERHAAGAARASDLRHVDTVAISPDGRDVYVGSIDGLTIFDRLPGGALRRKPGARAA